MVRVCCRANSPRCLACTAWCPLISIFGKGGHWRLSTLGHRSDSHRRSVKYCKPLSHAPPRPMTAWFFIGQNPPETYNVIPESADSSGTVRTFSMDKMRRSRPRFRLAHRRGLGASVALDFKVLFHPVVNDEATTALPVMFAHPLPVMAMFSLARPVQVLKIFPLWQSRCLVI